MTLFSVGVSQGRKNSISRKNGFIKIPLISWFLLAVTPVLSGQFPGQVCNPVSSPVGVVNGQNSPAPGDNPNVFVQGNDGHIWLNSLNSREAWSDMGMPPAPVTIAGKVGAVTLNGVSP